jgi:hypothetical protein
MPVDGGDPSGEDSRSGTAKVYGKDYVVLLGEVG